MWCQPMGLLQVVGMWGERGGQRSWTETLCDRGKYDRCVSEKQENGHVSKVGREERK